MGDATTPEATAAGGSPASAGRRLQGPDAAEWAALLAEAAQLGATEQERAATRNPGELVLDLELRPRTSTTLADAARDSGLEWASVVRLVRALGLPDDPAARLTADEVVGVQAFTRTAQDLLGFDSTLQLARAAGAAMARVAEAMVTAARLRFELPLRSSGTPYVEVVHRYSELAEAVLPSFVRALDAALRAQIVAVAERMWSLDTEGDTVVLPRTVGFADLVGYTAAAADLSASELSAVLTEFDDLVSEIVVSGGGQIVKNIGDEAMFLTEDPATACRIAVRLVEAFGHGSLPPIRVGLAAGEVVSLFGDVYGAQVNLAARLVEQAEPSTVLVSEQVRAAAAAQFSFEDLAPLEIRGLAAPVPAARLRPHRGRKGGPPDPSRARGETSGGQGDGSPGR